jgi:hypothetical protein
MGNKRSELAFRELETILRLARDFQTGLELKA